MTKPDILTYQDASELFQPGALRDASVVITATRAMAEACRRRLEIGITACDVHTLASGLLADWSSSGRKLAQALTLGVILDRLAAAHPGDAQIAAMKKNRSELQQAMTALVEIGVPPEQLPDGVLSRGFRDAYRAFCAAEGSGVAAVRTAWASWRDAAVFRVALSRTLGVPDAPLEAVYLQGFYYVTPLQGRIIEALCGLGVPVIFLNGAGGGDASEVWTRNPRFEGRSSRPFSSGIPETAEAAATATPEIVRFRDAFSLVKRILQQDETAAFYSPVSKELRELFETFLPAREEKRHILAYPVGQYLMALYQMWDPEEKRLTPRAELLRACIASGWAGETFAEDSGLLATFDAAAPFFRACRTAEEWEAQAQKLLEVHDRILPLFEENDVAGVAQPLRLYAPFSMEREDASRLAAALHRITDDAALLFGDGKDVRLDAHFRTLASLLRSKARGAVLRQGERSVAQGVLERISELAEPGAPHRIHACTAGQLAEAMPYFLGGRLDEDEDALAGDVRGLYEIEAEPYLGDGRPVVLCCCDAAHLPGQPRPYPWPLAQGILAALGEQAGLDGGAAARLADYRYAMEGTRLADRWLFHLALRLPHLALTWVVEHQGKQLAPSPYLSVLAARRGIAIRSDEDDMLVHGATDGAEAAPPFVLPDAACAFPDAPPVELSWDAAFCRSPGWRGFFHFILQAPPAYRTEFQISFYLTALIAVLRCLTGKGNAEVARRVLALIPVRDAAMQSEIAGFAKRAQAITPGMPDGAETGEGNRPAARLYLAYLPLARAQAQFDAAQEGKGTSTGDGNACGWCPYAAVCPGRWTS